MENETIQEAPTEHPGKELLSEIGRVICYATVGIASISFGAEHLSNFNGPEDGLAAAFYILAGIRVAGEGFLTSFKQRSAKDWKTD